MMTEAVLELMKICDLDDVLRAMKRLYKDQEQYMTGYRKVWKGLLEMVPQHSQTTIVFETVVDDETDPTHHLTLCRHECSEQLYGLYF